MAPIARNNFRPWSCVYFLDDIRTIDIPLNTINELAGYKLKSLRGFQPLSGIGLDRIWKDYGSVQNFILAFSTGISDEQAASVSRVTNNDRITAKQLSKIDELTRSRDINEVIAEWTSRNLNKPPEEREARTKRLKRCYKMIGDLKEKYGYRCQIKSCGFSFRMKNGEVYCEAAHIKPLSSREAGLDVPENILILCPNHHKMLDYGAMKVLSPAEVAIDGRKHELFVPRGEGIGTMVS